MFRDDSVKILLFGTNYLSEVIHESIILHNDARYSVQGFVVDDEYYKDDTFRGHKVYKYSEVNNFFSKTEVKILLCIGYTKMNENREKVFLKLKKDGWQLATYVDPEAIIHTENIGEGNIFMDQVNISYCTKIGNGNIFHTSCILGHHSQIGNFNFFAGNSMIAGAVEIANNCFFGIGSIVRDKLKIADRTLVGGGCFVNMNAESPGNVYTALSCRRLDYDSRKFI